MTSAASPVLVIAEIGSVHDGSLGNALNLVDVARDAGADAVKFQTHIAAAETTRDAPAPAYFSAEDRFSYFERTGFDVTGWRRIKTHCDDAGLVFLSSPFSEEAVALLESIGMARYKIPSGEVTNLPLLEAVAATGKPVILSSGMSDWTELDRAVAIFRDAGSNLTVLQCSSAYPCPPQRVGLNVMAQIRERYGVDAGLSDHTLGPAAAVAAASLGARVIEKHLTFSRRMYGSDARHSMEPDEFAAMVRDIRAVEAMRAAPVDKDDVSEYREMKKIFEKSIVAARDLAAGAVLGRDDIAFKKPGTGIPAAGYREVLGRRLRVAVERDALLAPDQLE